MINISVFLENRLQMDIPAFPFGESGKIFRAVRGIGIRFIQSGELS